MDRISPDPISFVELVSLSVFLSENMSQKEAILSFFNKYRPGPFGSTTSSGSQNTHKCLALPWDM